MSVQYSSMQLRLSCLLRFPIAMNYGPKSYGGTGRKIVNIEMMVFPNDVQILVLWIEEEIKGLQDCTPLTA